MFHYRRMLLSHEYSVFYTHVGAYMCTRYERASLSKYKDYQKMKSLNVKQAPGTHSSPLY